MREAICRVLSAEGFLGGVEVAARYPRRSCSLGLRYSATREPVIRGIERVSRPSLRRYAGAEVDAASAATGWACKWCRRRSA